VPAEPEETEQEPPSSSAVPSPAPSVTRVLVVKASAYNSRRGQTDASPSIAAWGDRLQPGMKVIAVSRDLLELGLRRGQRVQIDGLEGDFVVLDRMPSRWRQKIANDLGTDVRAALEWGVREVEIRWQPAPEDLEVDEAFDAAGGVEHVAD
jgi:3D (Asp-Asp-Asp) domain-containing protein